MLTGAAVKLARVFNALPTGFASATRSKEDVGSILRGPYRASQTQNQSATR